MSASGLAQVIERARSLITLQRNAEARAVLAPLRGIAALVGPVEMLVAFSHIGDGDAVEARTVLARMPLSLEAGIGLAVGRMLLACGSAGAAFDRFRRILVQQPESRDAAAAAAEAASEAARPDAALGWAVRAGVLGAPAAALATARLQAFLDCGRHREAAALIAELDQAGTDVDALVGQVANRALGRDGAAAVDRMMSHLPAHVAARPAVATVAATAAFRCGDPVRAAALLAGAGGPEASPISLAHEIALETGDAAGAARALDWARRRVLSNPNDLDDTLERLVATLRTTGHDRDEILRWAARCAQLAGSGLRPGPDMLFDECVRWKNDPSQRRDNRGVKIAHALGTLAAEAALGSEVAVRNGATHARLSIAGRELSLRLGSPQIRNMAATLFAFEPGMLRWFAGFGASDVLVDVGANIGVYSVLAAGISGCRVVAVEPFSLNVAELEHNVAVNGLQERVTVLHAAATDVERVDTLYFGQSHAGAANQAFGRDDISEQYDDRDADRESVRGVPLDALVARGEIPFPTHVKIDVDGLEEPVIEGMRGILSDPRFKSLRMEIRWQEEARYPLVEKVLGHGFTVRVADDVKNLLFVRPPGR